MLANEMTKKLPTNTFKKHWALLRKTIKWKYTDRKKKKRTSKKWAELEKDQVKRREQAELLEKM